MTQSFLGNKTVGSSDYTPFTQNVFPEFYVGGFTYCMLNNLQCFSQKRKISVLILIRTLRKFEIASFYVLPIAQKNILCTGDFMKKVPTATCALRDR